MSIISLFYSLTFHTGYFRGFADFLKSSIDEIAHPIIVYILAYIYSV